MITKHQYNILSTKLGHEHIHFTTVKNGKLVKVQEAKAK
jgi:hypothetical protein